MSGNENKTNNRQNGHNQHTGHNEEHEQNNQSLILTLAKYPFDLVRGVLKNVNSNERFYVVKMLIDILGESKQFHASWSKAKHNGAILALLIGATLPEMLTSHDTAPRGYRAFLAKYFSLSHDHQLIVRTGESFCRQCHSCDNLKDLEKKIRGTTPEQHGGTVSDDQFKKLTTRVSSDLSDCSSDDTSDDSSDDNLVIPDDTASPSNTQTSHVPHAFPSSPKSLAQCSGSLSDCLKFNLRLFVSNAKLFGKLYGKLYALNMVINMIRSRSVFKHIRPYILSVLRSSLTMSSVYFIAHTYLIMIERMEAPKKQHYHFGLIVGSIFLATMEERSRLGAICQFMLAIYVNMFFYYSTPKNLKIWRYLLYMIVLLSLKRRGLSRTMLSLI